MSIALWFVVALWSILSMSCLSVIAWRITKVSKSLSRLLVFIDASGIDRRMEQTGVRKKRESRDQAFDAYLKDSRVYWKTMTANVGRLVLYGSEVVGMLLAMESRATGRAQTAPVLPAQPSAEEPTAAMDSEASDGDRDSDSTTHVMNKSAAEAALFAAIKQAPIPGTLPKSGVAAAPGERMSPASAHVRRLPPSPAEVSTRRPPPITLDAPVSASIRPRQETMMGLPSEGLFPEHSSSWEELKREGLLDSKARTTPAPRAAPPSTLTIPPGAIMPLPEVRLDGTIRVGQPSLAATMLSAQPVTEPGSAPPSPARTIAPIATKQPCSSCEEGLVRVGVGGVGRCRVCKGSGLVDIVRAEARGGGP